MLPRRVQNWLKYRVFEPGEQFGWEAVASHKVLSAFSAKSNGPWAISPSAMMLLWRLLCETKPRRILEFGSGISTRVFSIYAEQMAQDGVPVRVLSVDHDEQWLANTRNHIAEAALNRSFVLVHAPLSKQRLLCRDMVSYTVPEADLADVAGSGGFDLCLIDGPPGTDGRAGALPLAAPYLAGNCCIILDDAYRAGEQAVLREWRSAYKGHFGRPRLLLADSHGLAVAKWTK